MLPEPTKVIGRNTRFVMWIVWFDTSEAPDVFQMPGVLRWLDMTNRGEPLLMFQKAVKIQKNEPGFLEGLGQELPGFWKPGFYRVELWDDRNQVIVSWDFEVR